MAGPGKPGRKRTVKLSDLPRKPDVQFTPERKERYLEYLRKHGTYYLAAAHAGVSYKTIQHHRESDIDFKLREELAKEENTDALVQVARKRAIDGTLKPIIGGQFKDQVVAHETVLSDGLMSLLLKAQREEFGNAGAAAGASGNGNGGGGVLIVPQAPHSVMDWHKLYGEKAKGLTHMPPEEVQAMKDAQRAAGKGRKK